MKKLIFCPDLKLRNIAEPIKDEFGSDWLKQLVQDMKEVMEDSKGAGLAAVQIGVNKSVIIYKDRMNSTLALCNAEIIGCFGSVKSYGEGCLSAPGFNTDVKRFKGIKVKGQTIDGDTVTIKERGFLSIVLQHEIDHLKGILILDRSKDRKAVADYTVKLFKEEINLED